MIADHTLRQTGNMKPPAPWPVKRMTDEEKREDRRTRWDKLSIPELTREWASMHARGDTANIVELSAYTAERAKEQTAKQEAASRLDPIPAKAEKPR